MVSRIWKRARRSSTDEALGDDTTTNNKKRRQNNKTKKQQQQEDDKTQEGADLEKVKKYLITICTIRLGLWLEGLENGILRNSCTQIWYGEA